ncbi:DUF389 domain-containing protein [Urechidicola vernalis]|uniref:DUF389 domain-containing protein n=1 Tax=Urechidicola vernalis TaxID=3075600 RepID=A0ABU2Y498_9FLAO|nr:DUF389 domain-containing protein [Urechidicola sp. P050]MDT0552542.1 DUF389 domain-containing protein [Urechidicola sp. P050]
MSEETENMQTPEEPKKRSDLGTIFNDLLVFLKEILDIRFDTDKKATIEDVKDNISMKGHTAWVLVFSILIASIGLNVSSPAVVIGAMLISPLMGPILGVGLSIGINDIDTLKRSFVNLGVMIGLSLVTSFLFFKIPLFQDLTPEIEARIAPDARDVFIAISGGLALILAMSRRSKQTNTIAGVAIATALMPPLCVAGYGLAVWNWSYFSGAMFLFTINAIFIALATFLIVKFLQFPMVKYINSAKRKRVAQVASFLALVIFSFSVFQFYKLYKIDQFGINAKHLIEAMKQSGVHIFDSNKGDIDYKTKSIKLIIYGDAMSQSEVESWNNRLSEFELTNVKLNIEQSQSTDLQNKVEQLTDLYARNQEIIVSRDEKIKTSEDKIKELQNELDKYYRVPFSKVRDEARIVYSGLKTLSYGHVMTTNFQSIDTISIFAASWYDSIPNTKQQEVKLKLWLKTRLELDSVILIEQK